MPQPDYTALAQAHQADQVAQAGIIQTALAGYWDQSMDPTNLDASFLALQAAVVPLVGAGRTRSELIAQTYFDTVLAFAGYQDTISRFITPEPFLPSEAVSALYRNGYAVAKWNIAQGAPAQEALDAAEQAVLGSVKRQVLQAGRARVITLSERDPNMKGWARVSDGHPCAFCAMLVSRGPVYAETTGSFQAHDHCGCSVRAIPKNDPSGGWSEQADKYYQLWKDTNSTDWRTTYTKAVKDGHFA